MKRITALLLVLILVFAFAGCSGSGKKEDEKAGSEETAKATFTVGMECNYAPFNWTQAEEGETTVSLGNAGYADGYDVVMASYIAEKLGMELVIKKIEWTGLEPAVSSGEIDAIIAGMTETPERAENADFTSPYYESEMVCIVRGDDPLASATSLADFSGKTVLGQINTTYDEVIDQIPDVVHATPLANYPFMIVALKGNEVDAITAELPVALGVVSSNPELAIVRFAEGEGFVADTTVSIAVKKGNTELLEKIQGALDTIDQDTRTQWMLEATERQPSEE